MKPFAPLLFPCAPVGSLLLEVLQYNLANYNLSFTIAGRPTRLSRTANSAGDAGSSDNRQGARKKRTLPRGRVNVGRFVVLLSRRSRRTHIWRCGVVADDLTKSSCVALSKAELPLAVSAGSAYIAVLGSKQAPH
jgi:hypothetical protein